MVKAATLEFEFVADIRRLEDSVKKIEQQIGQTMRQAVAAHNKAEAAAERYAAALEKEAAAIGKTARQIKQMEINANALAAEQAGFTALAQRIRTAGAAFDDLGDGARKGGTLARHEMLNLGYQVQDIIVGIQGGQKLSTVFLQQGAQIGQIAASSGVGITGMARALAALIVPFAPLIAAATAVVGAFALFDRAISQGVDTKAMVSSLGLTHKEIKRLKDVSVSSGDVIKATFQVLAQNIGISFDGIGATVSKFLDWLTKTGKNYLAALYAEFVGTFRAIGAIVEGVLSGKGIRAILKDVGNSYKGAFDEANGAMTRFGAAVTKQVASNKLADLKKQADAIKADRTPKKDTHGEQLAREAEATEAQIRNLYKLAEAYGVSGAAALIAEAREKAESAAIKGRADVEASVSRQVRLAVAQRVADTAKASLAMQQQTDAQVAVNNAVQAGLIPASKAADMLRDEIALLPIKAALGAAMLRGDKEGAAAAKQAFDALYDAQEASNDARRDAAYLQEMEKAADQLKLLQAEGRMVGENADKRERALVILRAWQEAQKYPIDEALAYVAAQAAIFDQTVANRRATEEFNISLTRTADVWSLIAENVRTAASDLADAFGRVGGAIGGMASTYADFRANQKRLDAERDAQILAAGKNQAAIERANQDHQLKTAILGVKAYGDILDASRGFFKEGSDGYKALTKAVQVFRAIEFALSIRAMAQDAAATAASIANSVSRTATKAIEAVVTAISSLPFPLNLAAGAATIAALASIGVAVSGAFGGGGSKPTYNEGKGTVFGDSDAKSDSIKRSIELLADLDSEMLVYSRQMAASLKNIESQLGGVTNLVLRQGLDNVDGQMNLKTGYNPVIGKDLSNLILGGPLGLIAGPILKSVPILGDLLGFAQKILGGLFGTKKKVVGSGIFGEAQTLGDIESLGFTGQTFADIQKKKKVFGVTTSTKYSTQYGELDDAVENQFGKLLLSFADAIKLAAGPLGLSLDDVEAKLATFVVDIGKIDLKDLSGEEIQEKLTAIFGAQADKMAQYVIGGLEKFQEVGEGYFETLIRVASTVDAITNSLQLLGLSTKSLGVDASMAIADMFDSVSDYQTAAGAYFEAFYSEAEQAAAKTAQLGKVFDSLGIAMPDSIASFRALVEAQDLTTAAGQEMYAALIKLAPAFAEIVTAGQSAASAAAILRERQDLEKQILELQGNTVALRAAELAQLDPSNRALQERIYALKDEAAIMAERAGLEQQLLQLTGDTAALRAKELAALDPSNRALQMHIWALQDAQAAQAEAQKQAEEAARKARELADAWRGAGDSIMEEVRRIRGETDGTASMATLMSRFNAATQAARGGDIEAARSLPELSRLMLDAAESNATSRAELLLIRGQTAASLEQTYASTQRMVSQQERAANYAEKALNVAVEQQDWFQEFAAQQATMASNQQAANDSLLDEVKGLRGQVAQLIDDQRVGDAAVVSGVGKVAKALDAVSSGGDSFRVNVEGTVKTEVAA